MRLTKEILSKKETADFIAKIYWFWMPMCFAFLHRNLKCMKYESKSSNCAFCTLGSFESLNCLRASLLCRLSEVKLPGTFSLCRLLLTPDCCMQRATRLLTLPTTQPLFLRDSRNQTFFCLDDSVLSTRGKDICPHFSWGFVNYGWKPDVTAVPPFICPF